MEQSIRDRITPSDLRSVHFINANLGWAVGLSIIHTTNGGVTWNVQTSNFPYKLYDVSFVDEFNGWAVGGGEGIGYNMVTTDGGINWSYQLYGYNTWLYQIFFIDINNGWMSGNDGTILHSTDGGNNWTQQVSGVTGYMESIFFNNINDGWIAGQGGVILHTTDLGNTWTNTNTTTGPYLLSIFFTDPYHGWAVGDVGMILRKPFSSNSSVSISINDGWNILSVPLLATDMTASTLFPTAVSPFYSYDDGYIQVDTLENGKGFWAKFNGNQNVAVTEVVLNTSEILLTQGWNLIGPFSLDVPVVGITTTPPNILSSPFYRYEVMYSEVDVLKAGKGYWVKSNATGTLLLNVNIR